MIKKMKKIVLLLNIIIAACSQIIAQTNVSGFITANTNWTTAFDPYIITGNTVLDSGFVLTIDPGVVVKFDSDKSLQINGNLRAIGSNSDKIIFTSNKVSPAPGDWAYILFADKSTDYNHTLFTGSIMEYCVVEYAGSSSVLDNGAIRISASFPYIRNCEVRNNSTTGITIFNDPSGFPTSDVIKISNCYIHDNSSITDINGVGGGIDIHLNQSKAIVDSCTISNNTGRNAGGISCTVNNNTSKITNNSLIGNYNPIYNGGLGSSGTLGEVSHNLFYGNSSDGANGHAGASLSSLSFKNNVFVNNTSALGGIIYVYNQTMEQNTIVDNTSFSSTIHNVGGLTSSISYNTIDRNKLSGTNPNTAVYLSYPALFGRNNILNNEADYEVYTTVLQTTPSINAEHCWWNSTNSTDIDTMIYDFLDNNSLTIIDYNPFATSPDTIAPVIPPVHVIKTNLGGGQTKITWDANLEADLAGYKIYWGSPTGYSFSNVQDAGNETTDTITGISVSDTIAVTAYDHLMDGINDQMDGNESWYTIAEPECSSLFLGMSSVEASCSICNDGTATANVSGGLFPYSYSWNTIPVQTGLTATDLLPGIYTVTVTDYNSCVSIDSIEVTFLTNIDQGIRTSSISIFPNPANEELFVVSSSKYIEYTIYNSFGARVSEGISMNNAINISGLPNGFYCIKIRSGNQIKVTKFLKN
jgi:hypothetical protein